MVFHLELLLEHLRAFFEDAVVVWLHVARFELLGVIGSILHLVLQVGDMVFHLVELVLLLMRLVLELGIVEFQVLECLL